MKRRRQFQVLTTLTVTALIAATTAAGARPQNELTVAGHPCHSIPVKETYPVDSSGRRTAHADDSTATVEVFGSGKASMPVTIPPKSFDPHTASAQELHRYGFPPRPTSGEALARWTKLYPSHAISYVTPRMCSADNGVRHLTRRTQRTGTSAISSDTSPNWSGGLANQQAGQPGFTFAVVQWTEPTFTASCPTASGYSIWSGLGGWNVTNRNTWGLLQAGVDNIGGTGPNSDYAFWEALNQRKGQTLPEQVILNFPVKAGNKLQAVTYYNPTDHTITFQLYNITTGKLVTLGPWSGIVDQNGQVQGIADDYYDGTTAELIAERPSVNDNPINLRKTSSSGSVFADTAIGNDPEGDPYPGYEYPGWESLTMTGNTSTTLSQPSKFPYSSSTGSTGWTNTWKACS